MRPRIATPPPVNITRPKRVFERIGLTLGGVVERVRVAVALVFSLSSARDVGLSEHPIPAVEDEVLQDKLTVPLKPFIAVTETVEAPDFPAAEIVMLAGLADNE
jgi:hypothetical protein